ncbi:HAD family hydrolase [Corynebacterium tapiri]|uniref:HAD family hydrolase n=1 Tax=Corynebacterium tapiri TaxID=1448266 RepID=A0A5C4U3B2_9CORY|nr:HAD family hydrolase [Corynebacterium tapiri]TNL97351.1 HAD family hydrolase [Corynebacterium tapiri]
MSPRPTAAFFDLDKTIIATSSALAFGREFMHNGLVTRAEAMHFSLVKASYLVSGQTSEQMDTTRDQLTALVAGWDVDEVQRITTEAMHSVVTPVIYAEARDLIRQHREAGRDVVIVSASVTHLVHPIAAELGIAPEDVIASELEVEQGRFTGEVLAYLKGPAKAEAMRAMAERRGYDMAGSYAYSDSATDVPMLEQVGNPVAVNPDRALKKAALERGWTIRSFKDPVPLVTLPTARDIGIGAGVLAGLAAVTAGSIWIAQRGRNSSAS